MSRFFHRPLCLSLTLLLFAELSASLRAQPAPGLAAANSSSMQSPLTFFRELLAMNPAQREKQLVPWPPEKRAGVLAKLREYEAMTPATREEALFATELHWYLQKFMQMPATNQATQLAQVPERYRAAVGDRLHQWNILPPPLQQEALAHETTRDFFLVGVRTAARTNEVSPEMKIIPPPLRRELQRLDTLRAEERQRMYAHFQQFFELTAEEKRAILETLPLAERQQVEKTIAGLDRLPKQQREMGLRSLDQLTVLSEEQLREFFGNANRWKQLSPEEQQTWIKLSSILPPQPLPIMPPISTAIPVADNPGN